ncbi:hypothetical protein [Citrobacter portucalensis]|uniref:hypothetical protein n=1 Tax=Citrobacter portucalensis TaxID=1639133 RepID=UPI00226B0A90|nr:hypothetical protein [Citrobacter portucalensis]MCX8985134.1 hypothetical protein [Citrobacter portucalensis]
MSDIEDQPNPDEAAEAKRAYMREYMRKRRQSQEHGDQYRATARESMRGYMTAYRKRPDVAASISAKGKAKRAEKCTEQEDLRQDNPTAYIGQIIAKREKCKAHNEYMREYQQRPEAKARRRELFDQKPEEEKQQIREKARERTKISRMAKANGIDTKTARDILKRA